MRFVVCLLLLVSATAMARGPRYSERGGILTVTFPEGRSSCTIRAAVIRSYSGGVGLQTLADLGISLEASSTAEVVADFGPTYGIEVMKFMSCVDLRTGMTDEDAYAARIDELDALLVDVISHPCSAKP